MTPNPSPAERIADNICDLACDKVQKYGEEFDDGHMYAISDAVLAILSKPETVAALAKHRLENDAVYQRGQTGCFACGQAFSRELAEGEAGDER